MRYFFCYVLIFLFHQGWTTAYTWNGTNSSNALWSTSTNWSPNGVPGTADAVTINTTGTVNPVLDVDVTIIGLTYSSKTLDLNGHTITITGSTTCTSGSINNSLSTGSFVVNSTTGIATITNTTFGANLSITSARILLSTSTYNGTAYFEKTGTTGDLSNGGNTFNSTSTFKLSFAAQWGLANSVRDIFNNDATFINASTSILYVATVGANLFNGNIFLNNTSTGQIIFCNVASGNATLADGKTINVGSSGVTGGTVTINRFTQVGSTAQSLAFTGTTILALGSGTIFNGNTTLLTPGIQLNGATFNGTLDVTKTGTTNDQSVGGNKFNNTTSFTNSGTGYIYLANTTADLFNGDVTFTSNANSNVIYPAYNGVNTQFNGNVILNSSGPGIIFGGNTGTSTVAAGKTITVGSLGYTRGSLTFKNFTYLGTSLVDIEQPDTYGTMTFGPNTSFGGDVIFKSANINLNGAYYGGNASFTKTGGTNNLGNGGNTFVGTVSFNNTAASYYLATGYTATDTYNSDIIINNQNTGQIYLANNPSTTATPTIFNGNINVNQSGTGSIGIGNGGTTSTIATGKTVKVGLNGYSNGSLYLTRLTNNSADAINLDLSCSGTAYLTSCNFNSTVNIKAGFLAVKNNTFNAATTLEKCGASNATLDNNYGGNTYVEVATITNSGTGNLQLCGTAPDIYSKDVTFVSSNASYLYPNYAAAGTQYNGNIYFKKTSGGFGFILGSGSNATSTLAVGKQIIVSDTSTTVNWLLQIWRMTQDGTDALTINAGSLCNVTLGNTTFKVPVNVIGRTIFLQDNFFSSPVYFQSKCYNSTGSTTSTGGNTFNKDVTYENAGLHTWTEANTRPDTYNGNVYVSIKTSGNIYLAYLSAGNSFNGDITFDITGTGKFSISTGGVNATSTLADQKTIKVGTTFSSGSFLFGGLTQNVSTQNLPPAPISISGTGTASITVGGRSIINGDLTLNAPVVIFGGAALSTYNGIVTVTIFGGTASISWNGVHLFNNYFTVNHNTTTANVALQIATTVNDLFTFKNKATFNKGINALYGSIKGIFEFYGDVAYNYTGTLNTWPYNFGYNGGIIKFLGSNPQTVSSTNANLWIFNILINKSQNNVTATTNINMVPSPYPVANPILTLTSGNIIMTGTNYLSLCNGGSVSGGSATSFVDGKFRKVGNTAFTFPVGKSGQYMPISIDAPSATTNVYQIEAFSGAPPNSSNLGAGVAKLSSCQYWNFMNAGSPVGRKLTLNWDGNTCTTIIPTSVKVAEYNGTQWIDVGANNLVNNYPNGSITTNTLTTYGYVTFSSSQASDITYAKLQKELDGGHYEVSGNGLLRFKFDEEYFVVSGNNLNYKIYNRSNSDVTPAAIQAVTYGDNRYSLDVSTLSSAAYYVLEVSNQKGEKWYLRFKKN